MAREPLGDVVYDLVAEVAKARGRLCQADDFEICESALATAKALDHAIKSGHVPASPEILRKLRSAKGKLKRELEEWEIEEPELEVDSTPPAKRQAAKKKARA